MLCYQVLIPCLPLSEGLNEGSTSELISGLVLVTIGIAGGPDTPQGYRAIVSIVFADQDAMGEAMGKLGPVLEDVPNYANCQPHMLIGEWLDS